LAGLLLRGFFGGVGAILEELLLPPEDIFINTETIVLLSIIVDKTKLVTTY